MRRGGKFAQKARKDGKGSTIVRTGRINRMEKEMDFMDVMDEMDRKKSWIPACAGMGGGPALLRCEVGR